MGSEEIDIQITCTVITLRSMGIDGLIVLDKTGLVLSSLYCPFSLITE